MPPPQASGTTNDLKVVRGEYPTEGNGDERVPPLTNVRQRKRSALDEPRNHTKREPASKR